MIESKVSKTILQEADRLEVGGVTIEVAPPSTATLIKVSELISKLPDIDPNSENIVVETLRTAKNSKVLGEIGAFLLLGAKGVQRSKGRFGFRKRITVSKLSRILLEERPKFLKDLIIERLKLMEVQDFFAITTSLSEANLLKKTREVVN